MSKRQVIILWIVALCLGIAVTAVKFNQRDSFRNPTVRDRGETLFEEFPATEVASIHLSDGEQETTLTRSNDTWTIDERDDFPASFGRIAEFLRGLAEVKVTQGIEAGERSHGRFGLETEGTGEERGTVVTFRDDAGNTLNTVVFGKRLNESETPDPLGMSTGAGRFVRHLEDPSGVYAVGEVFPQLSADPREWLRDEFVQVEKIHSIQVARPGVEDFEAWTLTRADEENDFTLEGADTDVALNSSATNPLKTALSNPTFLDVLPKEDMGQVLDSDQAWEVVIETFESLVYTLRIAPLTEEDEGDNAEAEYVITVSVAGDLPKERQPGADESEEDKAALDAAFAQRRAELQEKLTQAETFEGRVFKVTRWAVSSLLKSRADLIQKKAAEPASSAPPNPVPPMLREE